MNEIAQAFKDFGNFLLGREGDKEEVTEQARARWMREEARARGMREQAQKVTIFKQDDGRYRWIGVVSNHYRDRDIPKEIISGAAHKEYIEWAGENNKFPALLLWHVPGSKIGQADMLDFADGFLVGSGLFDDDKQDVAKRLAEGTDELTMSHGFVKLKYDPEKVITDRYRMLEMSITPAGAEANPWTRFGTMKEDPMLSEVKKMFLVDKLGAEWVAAFEGSLDDLRKAAEASGVDWKEVEGLDETPTGGPEPPSPTGDKTVADVGAIVEAVMEKLEIKGLADMITDLKTKADQVGDVVVRLGVVEAAVKELQKSDDEKVAQTMTPKAAQVLPWHSQAASKSDETKVKEGDEDDKKLVANEPSLLGMATQIAGDLRQHVSQQGG